MLISIFGQLDTVEREVFVLSAEAKIKVKVMLSSKSSSGGRLASDYNKSYSSAKYNNTSEMNNLILRTSDYIVFSFAKKDGDDFLNEEIFVSYPNMKALFDGIAEFDKGLKDNYEELFFVDDEEGGVHIDEDYLESTQVLIEGLASDKNLMFSPAVYVDREGYSEPGVAIFFNMNEYYSVIPMERYNNLKRVLKSINLVELSQSLINFAASSVLFNSLQSGAVPSSNSGTTSSGLGKKPTPLGLGKKKPSSDSNKPPKRPVKPASTKKKTDIEKLAIDEEDENEPLFTKEELDLDNVSEDTKFPFDVDEKEEKDEDDDYDPKQNSSFFAKIQNSADNMTADELFDEE